MFKKILRKMPFPLNWIIQVKRFEYENIIDYTTGYEEYLIIFGNFLILLDSKCEKHSPEDFLKVISANTVNNIERWVLDQDGK